MTISASDWINADVVWLVTLTWRGQDFRYASLPITLNKSDGSAVRLGECPAPLAVIESIGELTTQPKGSSAVVEIVVDGVDLLAERIKGHRLDGASVEIAYVTAREGAALQVFEDRELVVDAILQEPEYGDPDAPIGTLRATVEQTNTVDPGLVTGGEMTISEETFPSSSSSDANYGKPYPIVFGGPGESGVYVTPAYEVINPAGPSRYVMIAGHAVAATTVQVSDEAGNTAGLSVQTARDALGRLYSYVDCTSATFPTSSSEFYVGWLSRASGGLLSLGNTGSIRGAGDLAVWLVSRSGIPIDFAAWSDLAPTLNRYLVDGYINDEVSPLDFLTDELLSVLPVGLVGGSGGYRPVSLIPPEPDDLPRLNVGDGFRLATGFQVEGRPEETAARVTVRYAPDKDDNYRAAAVVSDVDTSQGRFSRDTYKTATSRVIEWAYTDDQGTAEAIAAETVMREALLPESFQIEADLRFGWIRAGEWLLLDYDGVWSGMQVQVIQREPIDDNGLTVGWLLTMLWREVTQRDEVQP